MKYTKPLRTNGFEEPSFNITNLEKRVGSGNRIEYVKPSKPKPVRGTESNTDNAN